MDAGDFVKANREQPKRVVVAQVLLAGDREPWKVVERSDVVGADPGLVELTPVEVLPFVTVARQLRESPRLQGLELGRSKVSSSGSKITSSPSPGAQNDGRSGRGAAPRLLGPGPA
jgi:hypothetical protein